MIRLPRCVNPEFSWRGNHALYLVNKEISLRDSTFADYILTILPIDISDDEDPYVSIGGCESTTAFPNDLKKTFLELKLVQGREDTIESFCNQLQSSLQELQQAIKCFSAENNRQYWMAIIPPLNLQVSPVFMIDEAVVDHAIISKEEAIGLFLGKIDELAVSLTQ
ncbi:hypothetical protein COT51_02740 [candidate division WWE3 bacterium CG08_land_8_20_14_0_20_41_15]|uniref:Uncharacterized protein n=1 Tax=candidate division WWE3 bacterium CG08_land_8_20_14_0_20_41_15 TaxID=1975086 RepID=A0A2H0X969_UNCKA|nr:MAG: hypothetical protein COT51_02740 [candidate division WWE3 bacterium CG08_land_8_20_14_0_20_41_15]